VWKGALANKDNAIRNHCQKDSIVFELDADDALLGRQPLNVINRVYTRKPNVWYVYAKYAFIDQQISETTPIFKSSSNKRIDPAYFEQNTYRYQNWVPHIRTYYRQLYLKIPTDYLID